MKKTILRLTAVVFGILFVVVIIAKMTRRPMPLEKPAIQLAEETAEIASRILANKLYMNGMENYTSGRLKEAAGFFELACAVDQSFQAAQIKLRATRHELADLIRSTYAYGLLNYQAMHFEEAILNWQRTISLADPQDQIYKEAEKNISLAAKRLKEVNL